MPPPITITIAGRTVQLNEGEARESLRRLVSVTRQYVWISARGRFDGFYRSWAYHNRGHSINLFLWVSETLGGADLPQASGVRRLKSQRDQIDRLLAPNAIDRFYRRFPTWHSLANGFANDMSRYQAAMQLGAGRTVRGLQFTRDASFMTLQLCAGFLTGGTSAAAAGTARAVATSMARGAAQQFVIEQLEHSATRVGRVMNGETVTARETYNDIVGSALSAVRDAALGEIVGRFMGPLTDDVADAAVREVSRGNLASGLAQQFSVNQMHSVVGDAINHFTSRRTADTRAYLRECRRAPNANACANTFSGRLMANRNFRTDLEQRIRRAAR